MKKQLVRTQHDGNTKIYNVYGSVNSFIEHCRKHMLSQNDCWNSLLDKSLVEEARILIGMSSNEEILASFASGTLAKLYEVVCGLIDREIKEAATAPRYVWYKTVAERDRKSVEVYLSSIGMIMPCTNATITTAYIKSTPEASRRTWAISSYEGLVRNFKTVESSTSDGIHKVTEENWLTPPLPEGESTYFGKLVDQALARKTSKRKRSESEALY
jgi:hypothetical protein